MNAKNFLLFLSSLLLMPALWGQIDNPKREFRGAWVQCVNGQWTGLGRDRMQQTLSAQLDELQKCGINAVFFQVRAEGDALYASHVEPWSRFLTGRQGQAPSPLWDPLAWMVEQCHRRGMELHAWINPYRAKTKNTTELSPLHDAVRHPERTFAYDGLLIFDPALPENRQHICRVVRDILTRYDVDGLHMDDYFYPYPAAGQPIPDDASFARYGTGFASRADWRRHNVNLLIATLHDSIRAIKPWVKFGISPFGIYHNASPSSPIAGSATRGLQNYDDLYADVLEWTRRGWVDYIVPQIYWQIGHPTADYATLIKWWSDHASKHSLLYIGQDVERTVKYADPSNPATHQMAAKYRLQRSLPGIEGSCQWYAAAVCNNPGQYATLLKTYYHSTPALQPLMPWIDHRPPRAVRKPLVVETQDGPVLMWGAPKAKKELDRAHLYVVYRFAAGERIDLSNPHRIVGLTENTYWPLSAIDNPASATFVVTALDRLQNESKGRKVKVK